MNKEKDIFHETFEQASKKLDETFNSPDLIPFGEKILKIIESNPSDIHEFEQYFIDVWESGRGSHELIAFCMHALKWPNLKSYFQSKHTEAVKTENWRAWHCLEDILEAFDNNWEDAQDFYAGYFNRD